jgi:hypothetical protein
MGARPDAGCCRAQRNGSVAPQTAMIIYSANGKLTDGGEKTQLEK